MSARDEVRRDYIIGCLREAGAMCEDDARAYLAYHDAARRAEVLNEAADVADQTGADLTEAATPEAAQGAYDVMTKLRRMAAEAGGAR